MQIYKDILMRVEKEDLDENGMFVVPDGVKEISCSAFMFCNKELKKIIVQEGVERIESFAFFDCENLVEVQLPRNLKEAGELLFFNCYHLKGVEFKKGIEKIGKGAFSGCVSLDTVIIPNTVKEIGTDLFYGCSRLKRLAIPEEFEGEIQEILGPYFKNKKEDIDILYTTEETPKEKGE